MTDDLESYDDGEEFLSDELLEDEDWGDEEFGDGEDDEPAKPKKSLSSNTLIIIGAVVVGIAVMLFQLSKTPEKTTPEQEYIPSSLQMRGQVNNPVLKAAQDGQGKQTSMEDKLEQTQGGSQGFLKNPNSLSERQENKEDVDTGLAADDLPPMPNPVMDNAPEAGTPLMPMPTPTQAATSDQTQNQGQEPEIPALEAPRAPSDLVDDKEIDAQSLLESKIAERQQKQNLTMEEQPEAPQPSPVAQTPDVQPIAPQPVQQPVPVEPQPASESDMDFGNMPQAPAATTMAVSSESVDALTSKLDDIIARIEKLEQATQGDQGDLGEAVARLENEISAIKAAPSTVSASKKTEVVAEPKKVTPVKKATKAPKKARVVKKTPVPTKWELRAAQPGKAWVSAPGEKEMRSVVCR